MNARFLINPTSGRVFNLCQTLGFFSVRHFEMRPIFLPRLGSKINCDKKIVYLFPVPRDLVSILFSLKLQFNICALFSNSSKEVIPK
jgi:hypothetical protein